MQRQSRANVAKLELKEQIAILELTILFLQQSIGILKLKDDGTEESLEEMFVIRQCTRIISVSQRVE